MGDYKAAYDRGFDSGFSIAMLVVTFLFILIGSLLMAFCDVKTTVQEGNCKVTYHIDRQGGEAKKVDITKYCKQ